MIEALWIVAKAEETVQGALQVKPSSYTQCKVCLNNAGPIEFAIA